MSEKDTRMQTLLKFTKEHGVSLTLPSGVSIWAYSEDGSPVTVSTTWDTGTTQGSTSHTFTFKKVV